MNILFLLKSFDVGGVEVVTSVLANRFASEGHRVVLWAFYRNESILEKRLSPEVTLIYGDGFSVSYNNVMSIVKTMEENEIDIVVNQWALPPQSTSLLKKALKLHPAKLISVYHSDPMVNGRIMSVDADLCKTSKPIKSWILRKKRIMYKLITSYSMRRCYNMSDVFVVLAESYKKHLIDFIGVNKPDHIIAIANPTTIEGGNNFKKVDKQKKILYVGRLECENKKPERVLNIWKSISQRLINWQLDIVGDGPDRIKLENMVMDKNIDRVNFYGYQNPIAFYQSASVLLLTSEFEGFPLVLTEAMSFGVVPIVYGSFSAINDIIDDGINGFIVHKSNGLFNHNAMVEIVESLINNASLLQNMSLAAIEKSRIFSIDHIYGEWMKVMNELKL